MPRTRKLRTTMAPPPESPPSTSPDAILEGIKQGTAIEIQLVKNMRHGLETIVDGLQKEAYNRSDACDELRAGLEAMGLDVTGSRKPSLKNSIEDGIRKCDAIQAAEDTKRTDALRASNDQWREDAAAATGMLEQLQGRKASLDRTKSILEELRNLDSPSTAVKELRNKLVDEYDRNVELYNQDAGMMKKLHERLRAGYVKESALAKRAHGEAVQATREFRELFESMAQNLEGLPRP